jgi:hypothetical protein
MDLNPARRKRERAIADEIVAELMREITTTEAVTPERIAHCAGLVFERLGVLPDDGVMGRVLGYAMKELARKNRELAYLRRQFDRFTCDAMFAAK